MKKLRIWTAGIVLLLAVVLLTGCGGGSQVAARVNGAEITEKQMDDYLLMVRFFSPDLDVMLVGEEGADLEVPEAVKEQMLAALIESELIRQEVERLELEVPQETVDNLKEDFHSYLTTGLYDGTEGLQERMNDLNLSQETVDGFYRDQADYEALLNYYQEQVTDEEIESFVAENPDMMQAPASATISHILVAEEEQALEVISRLQGGETFADLAGEFSIDQANAGIGGLLGTLYEGDPRYDATFIAAAFTLGEGEVSEPVETQFGWHIIKAEDVQAARQMEIEEVKEELVEIVAAEKFDAEIARLKEEGEIENLLFGDDTE